MRTLTSLLCLTVCIGFVGCSEADEGTDPDSASSAGGKADDVDDDETGEPACSLDASEPRNLVQFVNNDHIQFRCQGSTGFVDTACCEEDLDEYQLTTGCPLQAKFNDASGAQKRCVADEADDTDSIDGEPFVPTSCCSMLCDPEAGWDDPTERQTCRNSKGQFHPHACCMMNDNNRCDNAEFDEAPDIDGFRHCRAQSGEFAGQFAPSACCIDACFDIIDSGGVVPISCMFEVEAECQGTTVDSSGSCRTDDGRWAIGACCDGLEGLDRQRSDDCWLTELLGEDVRVAGCDT